MGAARVLFFGFSISSFSLSTSSLYFVSGINWKHSRNIYLNLFVALTGDGLARERVCSACNRFLDGELILYDVEAVGLAAVSVCLTTRSPIFAFRNATGILLTRISIRVLNCCACIVYCARSFLARSVTVVIVSKYFDM